MKALVYHGPGQKAWQDVPDPTIIDPTDVIVAVDTTTICGTDLHILKGDVPDGDRRADPRPRGRRHDHRGRPGGEQPRGRRPGDHLLHHLVRACVPTASQQLPAHCLADEGASGHRLDPRAT